MQPLPIIPEVMELSGAKRLLAAKVLLAANVMVIRSFAAPKKWSRRFWRVKKSQEDRVA
jgi:hypothetical protein